jgi:hypothetical protein
VLVGIAPVIFLQPVLLAFHDSWEWTSRASFEALYSIEAPICAAMAALALIGAYNAGSALRTSQEMLAQLEDKAGESQGLLEAAMPPFVARALLSDIPPEELTRSFDSASIAFVALEDYATKVSVPSAASKSLRSLHFQCPFTLFACRPFNDPPVSTAVPGRD